MPSFTLRTTQRDPFIILASKKVAPIPPEAYGGVPFIGWGIPLSLLCTNVPEFDLRFVSALEQLYVSIETAVPPEMRAHLKRETNTKAPAVKLTAWVIDSTEK